MPPVSGDSAQVPPVDVDHVEVLAAVACRHRGEGDASTDAVIESNGEWTVIIVTNLDPPTGEQIGGAIVKALGPTRRP